MNLRELVRRPQFLCQFEDWAAMRKIRICITGHRGLLGSLIVARLAAAGITVIPYEGDVTDSASLTHWIRSFQPQALLHLAAIVPVQRVISEPVRAMQVNATCLIALAEAVARHSPDSWVFLGSTSHVYDNSTNRQRHKETCQTSPQTLYGATKLAGERILIPLAEHFETPLCVGRIFSYFHEHQPISYLVPNIVQRVMQAKDGDTIEITNGNSIRDFLHVDMVVDAILHLCMRRHTGIVNIASGRGITVEGIAERLIAMTGKQLDLQTLPTNNTTRLVADVSLLKSIMPIKGLT